MTSHDQHDSAREAAAIDSVAELLAHSHALESEAAERYEDMAAQMDHHNNPELAELFRKMSAIEAKHIAKVDEMAEEVELPRMSAWDYRWIDPEAPETTPVGKAHYRMTPHHALVLMLQNEERAVAFFTEVAKRTNDGQVRAMAEELAEEERHHVELLKDWMARYPEPAPGWEEDLDEPVSQE
jgi:rubrerythrin